MRGRHWKVLALATVMATGVAACGGGDEPAEDAGATDMPAATSPADDTVQPAEQQAAPTATLPEGVTQAQVDEGNQIFHGAGGCHACHGPDAKGTQLAPDLTDDQWLNISGRNVDEIAQLIHSGVPEPKEHPGPMPPMGGANLTDAQVQALAAYVASLGQG